MNMSAVLEQVAAVYPPLTPFSGLAISPAGEIYLSFPRHSDNHSNFSLGRVVNQTVVPLALDAWNFPSANLPPSAWLVSPHGLYFAPDGLLWVIDDGKRNDLAEIPPGAAKLVAINPTTLSFQHCIVIPPELLRNSLHLNDLRIDTTHGQQGTAYIANSGFGADYSLFVTDIASGYVRELFHQQPAVSPTPGYMAFIEGIPKKINPQQPTFPTGGMDGISLSADQQQLYWTCLSGRRYYSLATALLSRLDLPETALLQQIKDEGEHPACDSICTDPGDNLYFGAYEQCALTRLNRQTGQFELIVRDTKQLGWPDSLVWHDGYIYVTQCQANRQPGFNAGHDLRQPPFSLFRAKVMSGQTDQAG